MLKKKRIGVLSLQGAVGKHCLMIERAGALGITVRTENDLETIDALIIPGGESTTIGKLLIRNNLFDPLKQKIQDGLPVFGTCAGMILLAKKIVKYDQPVFAVLDIEVERNAYGRQVDSFEADVTVPACGSEPVRAVFIRAPRVTKTGPNVDILAEFENVPILIRQGTILASSFHPELTDDARIHQYFLSFIP